MLVYVIRLGLCLLQLHLGSTQKIGVRVTVSVLSAFLSIIPEFQNHSYHLDYVNRHQCIQDIKSLPNVDYSSSRLKNCKFVYNICFRGVSVSAIVRLLPFDLEVVGLYLGNNLSLSSCKTVYLPSPNHTWLEPRTLGYPI